MAEAFAIVQWEDGTDEQFSGTDEVHTPHLANMLLECGAYGSAAELDDSLQRAFRVCMQLHIPIASHFRRIHVYDQDGERELEWALSDLALYLLLLNGNPQNPGVAHAQAWAIRRALR